MRKTCLGKSRELGKLCFWQFDWVDMGSNNC